MPDQLLISQIHLQEMLAHLRSDLSIEQCGLLAGANSRVTRVLPVPNAAHSPVEYRMDGQEFVDALKACDWEPLAVYHSHLHGPPVPSATDVAAATIPEAFYVIASFHVEPPSVRAFCIVGGRVTEARISIE